MCSVIVVCVVGVDEILFDYLMGELWVLVEVCWFVVVVSVLLILFLVCLDGMFSVDELFWVLCYYGCNIVCVVEFFGCDW